MDRKDFLCVSRADMEERGLSEVDFVFVSGDAYVDHPTFAAALLGRLLEANGFTVGILPKNRAGLLFFQAKIFATPFFF